MIRLSLLLSTVLLSSAAMVSPLAAAEVRVTIDPPLAPPEPVAIGWAPPPMLDETWPNPPDEEAVWVGGYWTWNGDWCWARGRWMEPPQPGYVFLPPYYENRNGSVIFVGGFWGSANYVFLPPPPSMVIARAQVRAGVVVGPRLVGPSGVFVPAPPGSRPGIIVPAPLGTRPSVVLRAPPVIRAGMAIRPGADGHVVIRAPAGVTRDGRQVNSEIAPRTRGLSSRAANGAAISPARAAATHDALSRRPPRAAAPTHVAPPRPMSPPRPHPMAPQHAVGGGHHR